MSQPIRKSTLQLEILRFYRQTIKFAYGKPEVINKHIYYIHIKI